MTYEIWYTDHATDHKTLVQECIDLESAQIAAFKLALNANPAENMSVLIGQVFVFPSGRYVVKVKHDEV